MEKVEFTSPEPLGTPSTDIRIIGLEILTEPPLIRVMLKDSEGRLSNVYYREEPAAAAIPEDPGPPIVPAVPEVTGNEVRDMIRFLNKADLSSKSLNKRIMERLLADGHIGAGTITGTPE